MIILLAGYNGFLGKHVEAALKKYHTIYRYYRHISGPYDTAVKECDVIVNCAGNTECPETMFHDNVKLTENLLEGARAFGKRLIHVGSIVEDLPGNSVYQVTKRAATQLCLGYTEEWNVPVSIVKPSTIYGVGDKETAFLPTLWRAHAEKTPVRVVNEFRGWVHVKDAAAAITILATNPTTPRGVYEVTSDYRHNLALLGLFEQATEEKMIVDQSVWKNGGADWPRRSCTAIRTQGWKPAYDIDRGVREFVEWKQVDGQVWIGADA